MRSGEVEGKDYYFISTQAFEAAIAEGRFYEHAQVHGQWKGVYKEELQQKLEQGIDVLLSVDVQGAAAYRQLAQQDPLLRERLTTVFILPPSLAVLKERLSGRGDVPDADLQFRLSDAQGEIEQAKHFHYRLTSSTPEQDIQQIEALYCKSKIWQRRRHALMLLQLQASGGTV
jgi:guanylate kinase